MRSSRLFWGVVLVLAGSILVLQNLGILPGSFWGVFWPLALILFGGWILIGPTLRHREWKSEAVALPLQEVSEATIEVHHGAGQLYVDGQAEMGHLFSGSFAGGVRQEERRDGNRLYLKLRPAEEMWGPWVGETGGLNWNLSLTGDIPLRLLFKTGAGENKFNFESLNLEDLQIETGASSSDVTLSGRASFCRVSIKAGAASVQVRVPEGVAASIRLSGGLMSSDVNSERFPNVGGEYRSPDYDRAARRVEISIEAGAGSISII
jgi:hypothetical protein